MPDTNPDPVVNRQATTVMSQKKKQRRNGLLLILGVLVFGFGIFFALERWDVHKPAVTNNGALIESGAGGADSPAAPGDTATPETPATAPATAATKADCKKVHIDARACTKPGQIRAVKVGRHPVTYFDRSCVKVTCE